MNTVTKKFLIKSEGVKIVNEPIYSIETASTCNQVEVELYEDFKPGKPQPAHWLKALLRDHYEECGEEKPVFVVKGTCLDMRTELFPKDRIDLWVKKPGSPFLTLSKQIIASEAAYQQDKNFGITLGDILRQEGNACYQFALVREQVESMVIISGI